MPEAPELHSGPGMQRLLEVLAQGTPAPPEPKRFDETTPDGLVRLVLEPDGACTVDIDHFGAEAEDGVDRAEESIKTLYNRATGLPAPKADEEEDR